jgi:predicted RNase H-like HicB family nuclease
MEAWFGLSPPGGSAMLIRAILEWDDEAQAYSATCPELNFVSSFGQSREEAIANLKEAIQLMLEPIPDEFLEMAGSREIVELAL